MKKTLFAISLGMLVFASCDNLSLSEEQKSGNGFEQAVGQIDPSQNWNIAAQGTSAQGITVTPSLMITKGNNGQKPISFDGIEMRPAEFFRVTKQGNNQFKVKLVRIESEMDKLNIGAYYYDDNKVLHETFLYENVNPESYNNGAVDVKIDGGLYFGIWIEGIKGADTVKYYSQSKLNADKKGHVKYIKKAEYKQQTSNHPYIFIEDGTGTADFQDIVLQVTGNEELDEWVIEELDEDLGPWTLFCEDVGNGGDYDFNDVVLTVSKRAGQNVIDIDYQAVGATNAVYVFLDDLCLGEVHAKFGVGTKYMINTYSGSTKPVRQTVDVKPGFTMSSENMGGFRIVRGTEDGPESVIYEDQTGLCPFIVCVPAGTKYCKEQISIFDAYPKFREWARDKSKNLDWYLEPNPDCVVTPKYLSYED